MRRVRRVAQICFPRDTQWPSSVTKKQRGENEARESGILRVLGILELRERGVHMANCATQQLPDGVQRGL